MGEHNGGSNVLACIRARRSFGKMPSPRVEECTTRNLAVGGPVRRGAIPSPPLPSQPDSSTSDRISATLRAKFDSTMHVMVFTPSFGKLSAKLVIDCAASAP